MRSQREIRVHDKAYNRTWTVGRCLFIFLLSILLSPWHLWPWAKAKCICCPKSAEGSTYLFWKEKKVGRCWRWGHIYMNMYKGWESERERGREELEIKQGVKGLYVLRLRAKDKLLVQYHCHFSYGVPCMEEYMCGVGMQNDTYCQHVLYFAIATLDMSFVCSRE